MSRIIVSAFLATIIAFACSAGSFGNNRFGDAASVEDATYEDARYGDAATDARSMIRPERDLDPVVLTGANLTPLLGIEPEKLVAFRYSDSWKQVPVQVDERVVADLRKVRDPFRDEGDGASQRIGPDEVVYSDPGTPTGSDLDPLVDADDEVVVMFRDAGSRIEQLEDPKGVVPGSGIEVRIFDPLELNDERYIYLFVHDGSLDPIDEQPRGTYTFNLLAGRYPEDYEFSEGLNPESTWFKSLYYERRFTDQWVSDVLKITVPGASGVDILDSHNNIYSPMADCEQVNVVFMSNCSGGGFVTNKSGPVRSIRSYIGACSASYTVRTHLFYEQREDIITDLRVHPIPGMLDFFDYSSEAVGMEYHNSISATGATIDGVPDKGFSRKPITDSPFWEMVSGEQGSLVIVYSSNTDIELERKTYYLDEAPTIIKQCVGDDSAYGASGVMIESQIPCTDPDFAASPSFPDGFDCSPFLQAKRVLYYLAPATSVLDAKHLATLVSEPLVVTVAPLTS